MAVFGSIWDDIKYSFRMGNMVTRLAILNFGVFVAVNLVKLTLWIANSGHGIPDYFDDGLYFFCMPGQWQTALFHPWGSSWFATNMSPYLWSIFKLNPDVSFVTAMPHLVKLHIVLAFLTIGFFPFTRLVHLLVVPNPYLWRKTQIVRWYGRKSG